MQQMRVGAVADRATLVAWLEYVYTDDVPASAISHPLYLAALRCHMERLATICEAYFTGELTRSPCHFCAWACFSLLALSSVLRCSQVVWSSR